MTRILLFIDRPEMTFKWLQDERTPRELMFQINTGKFFAGRELLPLEERSQSAMSIPEENMISVAFHDHYVDLTERQFLVLFALADGNSTPQIAQALRMSEGVVMDYYEDLRARFDKTSLYEVLIEAKICGLL